MPDSGSNICRYSASGSLTQYRGAKRTVEDFTMKPDSNEPADNAIAKGTRWSPACFGEAN